MNSTTMTNSTINMATRFPNSLIRASAGTGKTYQLSNRYLQLILSGHPADRILAVTFTRKAAGEILERILFRLAAGAVDERSAEQLAQQLDLPQLTLQECRRVLRQLTRSFHRLRVNTLDAFFLKAAQSLSLELGLPPNWQIVDDVSRYQLQQQAVASLLEQQESGNILKIMHWLSKGETSRSVSRLINETVDGMYSIFLDSPPEAWHRLKPHPTLLAEEVEAHRLGLQEWIENGAGSDRLKSEVKKLADMMEAGDWEEFVESTISRSIFTGKLTYYSKPLPESLLYNLRPLAYEMQAQLNNQYVKQLLGSFELLACYDAQVQALKTELRSFEFHDLPRSLGRLEKSARWQQLSYRLDSAIESLLLDEFQDTSMDQWLAVRPFARHATANVAERTFFCVGDVKQAIYGWRGGNADLLDGIVDELPDVTDMQLDTSYRSSQPVIDVVNRVNRGLGQYPNLAAADVAVRHWVENFPEHTTARNDLAGYVQIETVEPSDDTDHGRELTIAKAVERVEELRAVAPHLSIALLFRKNAQVGRAIYLLQQRGIPASEEGGSSLCDSAAVQLIESLLTLADYPADTAARFHLAQSPWSTALRLESHRSDTAAQRLARDTRELLLDRG
ncbi:MAG: UvrD-helicase domain-containing protein, partial [Planctomycetales bacterium]|nr:UvrD-helicase domain-containing protein [Planctomycetales bacterium]